VPEARLIDRVLVILCFLTVCVYVCVCVCEYKDEYLLNVPLCVCEKNLPTLPPNTILSSDVGASMHNL